MFGIGMTELLVILAIALIVFGPKRLPELAKQLGKAMREFRKATDEVKENIGLNDLDLNNLPTGTESPPSEEKKDLPKEEEPSPSTPENGPSKELTPEEATENKPTSEAPPTESPPPKETSISAPHD